MNDGRRLTRRAFCAAGLVGLAAVPAWGRGPGVPETVKLGLVGSLFREIPAGLVLMALHPFKALLDEELGVKSQLVAGGDPIKLAEELRDGKVHLAVFHGTEFAWAKQRYPKLQPLLIAVNGAPTVTAHLIVKKGRFANLAQLQGESLVVPGRTREHAWMFLERNCVKPGMTPQRFYGEFQPVRSAEEAINEVVLSGAPAALIDDADWAAYQAKHPTRAAKAAPLLSSPPLPSALIACWDGALNPGLLSKFKNGMLAAAKTPKGRELLNVMRITGFATIPDGFDKQLEAAAKAYPPPAAK